MSTPRVRLAAALAGIIAVGVAVVGCAPSGSRQTGTPAADALPLVQGAWTWTTTHDDLRRAGVTDGGVLDENASSSVMVIRGRDFTVRATPQSGFQVDETPSTGTLTVTPGAVVLHWSDTPSERTRVRPHRLGNGDLAFTGLRSFDDDRQFRAVDRAIFTGRPWRPLSDAIQGTWFVDVSESDLRLGNVPHAAARAGRLWLRLEKGRWQMVHGTSPTPVASTGGADYRLRDDRLVLEPGDGSTGTISASVSPTPEHGLVFRDVRSEGRSAADAAYDRVALGAENWSPAP